MKLMLRLTQTEFFRRGWSTPALLLLFLSLIPVILPMADRIPDTAKPPDRIARARPHNRVVLIIVDGLSYRKATRPGWMPHLQARIKTSASGIGLASFPTVTPSGLRCILSGHRIVAEPELPTAGIKTSAESDSVMFRAAAAGLKSYVFGQYTWPPLYPNGNGAELTNVPYDGIRIKYDHGMKENLSHYDQQILEAAEPVFSGKRPKWDFVVLHLFESDPIGHALGTEDPVYEGHLLWIDRKVDELSRRLQEQAPTTFLLLADHGQAKDGTHGGSSAAEREVPFVMWGAKIKPINLGAFPHYNVAPTLAALLGIPPPTLTEGWPLFDALQLTQKEKASVLMDLLYQRLKRWSAVRAAWPWAVGDPMPQIQQIQHFFQAKKYELVCAKTERYIRDMDKAVQEIMPERWLWRIIAALACLVFATCFSVAWSKTVSQNAPLALALAGLSVLTLVLPLGRPGAWPWASGIVLCCSIGLLFTDVFPGFKTHGRAVNRR